MGDSSKKTFSAILVDDEIWALRGLKGIADWQAMGFDIRGEFTDSRKALDAIRTMRPDIIFTDIRMPGLDGMSLIETIKAEGLAPTIVIVTAYKDFEIARKALKNDVSDYLIKPLDKEEVRSSLSKLYLDLCQKSTDGFDVMNLDLANPANSENPDLRCFLNDLALSKNVRIIVSDVNLKETLPEYSDNFIEVYIKGFRHSYIGADISNLEAFEGLENIGIGKRHTTFNTLPHMILEASMSYEGSFFFSDNDQTSKIQEFMFENMKEKLSMDDLSSRFFLSKPYLFELFRHNCDMPAMNLLKHMRLSKAAKLLKEKEKSIREIALEVGFDDYSYFGKSFKTKYGCTPEQYATDK